MKKTKYILAATLLLPAVGYAQADRGNGGDAVICQQANGRKTVELLDRVEARKKGIEISIPGNTLREKVTGFITRYRNLDVGKNSKNVADYANELLNGIERQSDGAIVVWDDGVLFDIPDSNETSIPANCHKEQLIIRENPMIKGDPEYTIQSKLWAKMDLDNQAMAIAHEALFKQFNFDSSRFARAVNRYLNSPLAAKTDLMDFFFYLRENAIRFSERVFFSFPNDWMGGRFLISLAKVKDETIEYEYDGGFYTTQQQAKNAKITLDPYFDIFGPKFKMIFDRKTSRVRYENFRIVTKLVNVIPEVKTKVEFNGQTIFFSPSKEVPSILCDTDIDGNITEMRVEKESQMMVVLKDGTQHRNVHRVTLDANGIITSIE